MRGAESKEQRRLSRVTHVAFSATVLLRSPGRRGDVEGEFLQARRLHAFFSRTGHVIWEMTCGDHTTKAVSLPLAFSIAMVSHRNGRLEHVQEFQSIVDALEAAERPRRRLQRATWSGSVRRPVRTRALYRLAARDTSDKINLRSRGRPLSRVSKKFADDNGLPAAPGHQTVARYNLLWRLVVQRVVENACCRRRRAGSALSVHQCSEHRQRM